MELNGNIVVVGDNAVLVSNVSTIDIEKDIIDTPTGKQLVNHKVAIAIDPYGKLNVEDKVQLAWKGDDGVQRSYDGVVTRYSDVRCTVKITSDNNNYKEILRRAKEWLIV
jgi:hypothetical protein